MITRLALIITATAALLASTGRAADSPERTRKLVAVLQSEASLFEKARACQQLGEIGNRDAVPALASLLADPHLSAYARSGLEGIPDASAAAALREAAGKLQGPLLAGVVNSLGAVRDAQAVELLGKLAADPGAGVTKEALLALGNIASPESVRILKRVLAKGPHAARGEAAAACLLAADRQRTAGQLDDARALYDLLRTPNHPMTVRVGATRGAILTRKTGRVPFLIKQLKADEPAIRDAALLTIRDIPDNALATALNSELKRAKPELQQQLLLALVDCHNAQSTAAVEVLASSSSAEIRKTALAVLGQLGPEATPALLTALQRELAAEEKATVLNGLRTLRGSSVDDLIKRALATSAKPGTRIDLIRLLDSRGVTKAGAEILRQATGPDKEVTIAALSALKSLAGPKELPGLIALIKNCADEEIRNAAETALAGACSRTSEGTAGAETVLGELKRATKPEEKNSWVRVLASIGYAGALPEIEAAAGDANETIAGNALEQLGRWPDPAPMRTLLKAMEEGTRPELSKRALTSVLDLAAAAADEGQRPESMIAQWLHRANKAAQSTVEKRRILGISGRLKTIESLQLLVPYLDDPALRTEAASGVVQIAPALAKGADAGTVQAALDKIAATVDNSDIRNRARQASKSIAAQRPTASLFDGRSLAGWEGDANVWRVRDNAIVGGAMTGNPRNEFLATLRNYTNFVLRLEYKLVGTEGFINGGVQLRSVRVTNPPNEMKGYQADIGAGYSGCLYDESRRNTFLARASEETIKRLEQAGDWNRYEIRCEGPHIQLWLNGEKTVDYAETDATIPQSGLIALQIHGDCKAEISFRNVTIQEF